MRDSRILGDNDDSLPDDVLLLLSIRLSFMGPDDNPLPNPGVLVDDGSFDSSSMADTHLRYIPPAIFRFRLLVLIKVRSHHNHLT